MGKCVFKAFFPEAEMCISRWSNEYNPEAEMCMEYTFLQLLMESFVGVAREDCVAWQGKELVNGYEGMQSFVEMGKSIGH